jgi:hypothetical protein
MKKLKMPSPAFALRVLKKIRGRDMPLALTVQYIIGALRQKNDELVTLLLENVPLINVWVAYPIANHKLHRESNCKFVLEVSEIAFRAERGDTDAIRKMNFISTHYNTYLEAFGMESFDDFLEICRVRSEITRRNFIAIGKKRKIAAFHQYLTTGTLPRKAPTRDELTDENGKWALIDWETALALDDPEMRWLNAEYAKAWSQTFQPKLPTTLIGLPHGFSSP